MTTVSMDEPGPRSVNFTLNRESEPNGFALKVSYLAAAKKALDLNDQLKTSNAAQRTLGIVNQNVDKLCKTVAKKTATMGEVLKLVEAVGALNDFAITGHESYLQKAEATLQSK